MKQDSTFILGFTFDIKKSFNAIRLLRIFILSIDLFIINNEGMLICVSYHVVR